MPDPQKQSSFLDELDQRQEDVLAQLDQLNAEVETLLDECLHARKAEMSETTF